MMCNDASAISGVIIRVFYAWKVLSWPCCVEVWVFGVGTGLTILMIALPRGGGGLPRVKC